VRGNRDAVRAGFFFGAAVRAGAALVGSFAPLRDFAFPADVAFAFVSIASRNRSGTSRSASGCCC